MSHPSRSLWISRAVVAVSLVVWAGPASARPMKFEETLIEAEVQKPEVAVYITRQNLNKAYDLQLKESFIPRIIEALEEPPF